MAKDNQPSGATGDQEPKPDSQNDAAKRTPETEATGQEPGQGGGQGTGQPQGGGQPQSQGQNRGQGGGQGQPQGQGGGQGQNRGPGQGGGGQGQNRGPGQGGGPGGGQGGGGQNRGPGQGPGGGQGQGQGGGQQGRGPGPNALQGGGQNQPQGRGNQQPGQQGQGQGGGPQKGAPKIVEVRPMAAPARMKRRHWGLIASFFLLALAPFVVATWYIWAIAIDQYGSSTGFTVRSEETGGAQDILGGFLDVGSTGDDSAILYEYVQSPELVNRINATLDLKTHYSQYWTEDPVFALAPDATAEDLLAHWERVVKISYDGGSGLIDMEVIAFTPEMAQTISREIVAESQAMINTLNEQARNDAMRYANEDLEAAIARLKIAREALTRFRTRTQIVDPASDLQGRMGVLANLQQQLAQALIDYDLLLETTTNPNDPRLTQASRRIEVIRERIADERQTFSSDSTEVGGVGEDYPTLIAEFESLSVDREVAEETYRATLTALDVARANASRQSRYLATYVRPTLPESAEYPQRALLTFMAAMICFVSWSVLALIYYSVRDRS